MASAEGLPWQLSRMGSHSPSVGSQLRYLLGLGPRTSQSRRLCGSAVPPRRNVGLICRANTLPESLLHWPGCASAGAAIFPGHGPASRCLIFPEPSSPMAPPRSVFGRRRLLAWREIHCILFVHSFVDEQTGGLHFWGGCGQERRSEQSCTRVYDWNRRVA